MQNQPVKTPSIRLVILALIVATVALAGCARDTRDDDRGPEQMYEEAHELLQRRNYTRAIQHYRQLTTRYPFGRHAEQAQLDMAYALYRAREPEHAIATLNRFIRTYPTHPNVDYAWYLQGLVHYDETMGFLRRVFPGQVVDRDQTSAQEAFSMFQELVRRHPQSRYVADARQRMVFLRNVMAEHDIVVGEYYFRRGAYIAALNRAKYVIENYPQAPANINALDLMARAYNRLDLPELAADTRRTLEHNYGDVDIDEEHESMWRRIWPFD
ncbi:outer membrane protein assembly factor BamD [Wenzhouxiangella sp. AB-CW3]|uniref:outer membrane protein assembly factor BamD n=1 Tax=Wenzhouxiangella sp. AB-CW3 TaxID=2771012 RepID=UPI001CC31CF4|nr:outer membrane protein assembly factor BamD [Wenzhouxiangella sp. AB-CW3]